MHDLGWRGPGVAHDGVELSSYVNNRILMVSLGHWAGAWEVTTSTGLVGCFLLLVRLLEQLTGVSVDLGTVRGPRRTAAVTRN